MAGNLGGPSSSLHPRPTLARPPAGPYASLSVIYGFNWFLWPSRMEPPAYIAYHGPFCIPMAAHQTCYPVCPQAEPRWGSPCILLYKVWVVAGPVAQTLISRVGGMRGIWRYLSVWHDQMSYINVRVSIRFPKSTVGGFFVFIDRYPCIRALRRLYFSWEVNIYIAFCPKLTI